MENTSDVFAVHSPADIYILLVIWDQHCGDKPENLLLRLDINHLNAPLIFSCVSFPYNKLELSSFLSLWCVKVHTICQAVWQTGREKEDCCLKVVELEMQNEQ